MTGPKYITTLLELGGQPHCLSLAVQLGLLDFSESPEAKYPFPLGFDWDFDWDLAWGLGISHYSQQTQQTHRLIYGLLG